MLAHEITIVCNPSRRGVYTEDRSICILGVDMPSIYLLSKGDGYTSVYTRVYPRVHNCIHACTLLRSKYILGGVGWDGGMGVAVGAVGLSPIGAISPIGGLRRLGKGR